MRRTRKRRVAAAATGDAARSKEAEANHSTCIRLAEAAASLAMTVAPCKAGRQCTQQATQSLTTSCISHAFFVKRGKCQFETGGAAVSNLPRLVLIGEALETLLARFWSFARRALRQVEPSLTYDYYFAIWLVSHEFVLEAQTSAPSTLRRHER